MAVDMLFDPLTYVGIFGGVDNIGLGAALAEGVDTRARNLKTLDAIRKGSLDYYATIRSLYRQHRNDEISNGKSASGGSPGMGTGGDDQSFLSSPPPQISATELQSASPLVPRQQPLAKALPLFIIKEPAGAIPVTTEP
jgi:hypothetical protein